MQKLYHLYYEITEFILDEFHQEIISSPYSKEFIILTNNGVGKADETARHAFELANPYKKFTIELKRMETVDTEFATDYFLE